MEGEREGVVAKNEDNAGGGGGGLGTGGNGGGGGGGSANGRRRWRGGGSSGYRQHPIIQAYPALLPLPINGATGHAHINGAVSLPLPLPPPVLLYLQPPPPPPLLPLLPKAAAATFYGKPPKAADAAPRGSMWKHRPSKKPPPHAITAALLPLPRGKEGAPFSWLLPAALRCGHPFNTSQSSVQTQ